MNKTIIFLLIPILLVQIQCSGANAQSQDGNLYQLYYDYGYRSGYLSGQQEKEEGYDYEPEVVLSQPAFQIALKDARRQLNITNPRTNKIFDTAFKEGWFAGYKEGYHGYPKRKTGGKRNR